MAFDPAVDIERIPTDPGCYLMRGAGGEVVYVGKAANLRARVRQYFGATSDTRYFVGLLDRYLEDIEVIITASEKEALILENELIKRHMPRFNVELKDDKNFLHLRVDDSVDWPKVDVVRRPRRDGARYFGPYHSASKVRETLKVAERHFQIRNCDDLSFRNRSRPCLQYQIKRCPGPCVLPVAREAYQENVRDLMMFLRGRHDELLATLRERMFTASGDLQYEQAARFRDQIRAIEGSLQPQQVALGQAVDRDVVAVYHEGGLLQLAVLLVRRGKLVGSRNFGFDEQGTPVAEVVSTFINLFYNAGNDVPDEVLLPIDVDGVEALEERLAELRGRRVRVKVPQRGAGRKLVEMAERNAEHAFFQARRSEAVRDGGLVRLKEKLRLVNLPYRIECYDISLFQGAAPVGSQVVFEGGIPKRSEYRHYKVRDVEGTDDFAMMREVLVRRLRRGVEEGRLPDLVVVDGGKGQLGVACAVLEDLAIEGVDVVGLAKSRVQDEQDEAGGVTRSEERVFLPGVREPIVLRAHTDELFLLAHLRDEAHRFAINFHRKVRSGGTLKSALDGIPGVGPARRRALLRAFGSVKGLRGAAEGDIAAIPGIGPSLARAVHEALR